MPKKNVKYNCPPKKEGVVCPLCNVRVKNLYHHVVGGCKR